jgi:hypothetical protein
LITTRIRRSFRIIADVHAYLRRYAETFGLLDKASFGATVTGLSRAASGYRLTYEVDGAARQDDFDYVGRGQRPL